MISDQLYIMSMSDEQMKNFAGFGYTDELYIEKDVFVFGVIHKFAVYYQPDKSVYYDTVKISKFFKGDHSKYIKLLEKYDKEPEYTHYNIAKSGLPDLSPQTVKSPHFL